MNRKIIIIGASGHGKVIADIVTKSNDAIVGFLDDNKNTNESFMGYPILGSCDKYKKYKDTCEFIIAIGNQYVRERIVKNLKGVKWYTAIHPQSVVSPSEVEIGKGTVVMANSVINASSKIGEHSIINTSSVVEHDNVIGNYAHISVGAKLGGNVKVNDRTWIGIGATIKNGVSICSDCMIGAGTVVVKNIDTKGTYIGNPARILEKHKENKA